MLKIIIFALLFIAAAFPAATLYANAPAALSVIPQNSPTPSRYICRNAFPIGSRQVIDYAYALTVRTGPGNHYGILTFVHRGDEFEILDYRGRFVQIYTGRGAGWIFAGFLSRGNAAAGTTVAAVYNNTRLLAVLESVTSIFEGNLTRGLWIDYVFYYGSVIDENVVFPVGFSVIPHHGGIIHSHVSVWTLELWRTAPPAQIMPVTMYELEPGIVELRYDITRPVTWIDHCEVWWTEWWEFEIQRLENRRMIIDTNYSPVRTIRYYIGETGYDLIRLDPHRDPSRYTVEAVENGVRLNWLVRFNVWHEESWLRIYRSTVQGERGNLVRETNFTHMTNREFFEFIDTDVSESGTYFYSLWVGERIEHLRPLEIGGQWQMTVRLPVE